MSPKHWINWKSFGFRSTKRRVNYEKWCLDNWLALNRLAFWLLSQRFELFARFYANSPQREIQNALRGLIGRESTSTAAKQLLGSTFDLYFISLVILRHSPPVSVTLCLKTLLKLRAIRGNKITNYIRLMNCRNILFLSQTSTKVGTHWEEVDDWSLG